MSNTCRQCKYFKKTTDLNNVANSQGTCLRYPPKPFVIPQQTARGEINLAIVPARPTVETTDFCGEFDLRNPPEKYKPPLSTEIS